MDGKGAQVLTDFLRQPSPNVLRAWLIFSFWPLLSTASVIVNNDRHMEVMGFSTQCVFNDSSRITTFEGWLTVIVEQMILAWGVLDTLGSYSSRALCLSAKAQLMVDWLARIPTRALISFQSTTNAKRSKLKELRDIWTSLPWASRTTPSLVLMRAQLVTGACFLLQFSLWAVFWPVFALYEISLSNIVDMWRVFGTLLMATWAIVNLKRLSASSGEMQGNENEWGFGQLLPVLLLILPILSVMQTLEGKGPFSHLRLCWATNAILNRLERSHGRSQSRSRRSRVPLKFRQDRCSSSHAFDYVES